jgi:rubrerythrin
MLNPGLRKVIETAIGREIEAYQFYTELAQWVEDTAARETLLWIAAEEQKHRSFLEKFQAEGKGPQDMRVADVVFYKIAEHLDEPEVSETLDRGQAFLVASHRELRSFKFYSELAELYEEGDEIRVTLLRIANEELKHKEKMEYLYANTAFPQTDGG